MRRLDRYITSEFAPLLVLGIGAFLVILIGVDLLPKALRMVVREGFPLAVAARVFIYRLPTMIALTLPMAVMFASLMTVAGLSAHGELLALRAGGIPFLRVSAAVIVAGFVLSLVTLGFNERIGPVGSRKAFRLVREYREQGKPMENITFQVPERGTPRQLFRMGSFSAKTRRAEDILVIQFRDDGSFWQLFEADYADWHGEEWALHNVVKLEMTPLGQRETRLETITIFVGKAPDQIDEMRQDADEMSIAQLQRLLRQRQALGLPYKPHQLKLLQIIQSRLALPWCALGFAMLGVALGRRPLRASAGVGFGVSLVVVFLYYLVFNALTLMGERGVLSPFVTAWMPNAILFVSGLYLLYNSNS